MTCQVTKGNVGGTNGETGGRGLCTVVGDPLPASFPAARPLRLWKLVRSRPR